MRNPWPNPAAPGNGGIKVLFHAGRVLVRRA